MHKSLSKEFELKAETLGTGEGEILSASFLGRTIRRTERGYEYECDQKHAKVLLDEWSMSDSRPVSSPGTAIDKADLQSKAEEEEPLEQKDATIYRRAAARMNFMSLDRADLSDATKESSRGMAKPTKGDVVRLKRTLRHLCGSPRVLNLFAWQKPQGRLKTFSNCDSAGCQNATVDLTWRDNT